MKIASAQMDVVFGDSIANAERAIQKLDELKALGVEVVVFPEAFLTGYCVSSLEEARAIAIARDSEAVLKLKETADRLDIIAVIGFAELSGDTVYNTAVLLEPGREPRFYQKTHLPYLGLDMFVCPGQELPVFNTRVGNIGILICYDLRPPEATRVLALNGADILILPTNWPVGAETSADHIAIARAAENRIFVATCNRVGVENGFTFIGRSKLIGVGGNVLAAAGSDEETLIAEMDLETARNKRTVNIPGKYEVEVFASRNPDLYRELAR